MIWISTKEWNLEWQMKRHLISIHPADILKNKEKWILSGSVAVYVQLTYTPSGMRRRSVLEWVDVRLDLLNVCRDRIQVMQLLFFLYSYHTEANTNKLTYTYFMIGSVVELGH